MLYDPSLILGNIALLSEAKTRSISAENPKGEKGAGGKEASNLGPGRKGRAWITLPQGKITPLAEIEGTGTIRHIWITFLDQTEKGKQVLRDLVLRMYWDGEENPSVEVPIGDFFCNGHAMRCNINSLPITVNPTGGMNCYFPMSFRSSARITIENQHPGDLSFVYYQITYSLVSQLPDNIAYFHAQWRREDPTVIGRDYTIVDGIKGKGNYVGTFLTWVAIAHYWWGEGEAKFYMDGDKDYPTICGTGTEDYAGGAWCFGQTYCTPFAGYPLDYKQEKGPEWNGAPLHSMYRWHILDPIHFEESLRVTIQQLGYDGRDLFERSDDVSSVAYWYQTEPHNPFPEFPPVEARRARPLE